MLTTDASRDGGATRARSSSSRRDSIRASSTTVSIAACTVYPGVATPTEVEAALEKGLTTLKFFPAEPMGGLAFLKAMAAPYVDVNFMPTGGINADQSRELSRVQSRRGVRRVVDGAARLDRREAVHANSR